MEVWCDIDMYIWSWIAGRCGTNNDRTLLSFSAFFIDILSGSLDINLPMAYNFLPGGRNRRLAYLLADGIYPEWSIFVRPIHDVPTGTQADYNKAQEGVQKDMERLFGVFQGRFRVLRRESDLYLVEEVVAVSEVCSILHNLLIRMEQSAAFDEDLRAGCSIQCHHQII